jgi:hypothetical protein
VTVPPERARVLLQEAEEPASGFHAYDATAFPVAEGSRGVPDIRSRIDDEIPVGQHLSQNEWKAVVERVGFLISG